MIWSAHGRIHECVWRQTRWSRWAPNAAVLQKEEDVEKTISGAGPGAAVVLVHIRYGGSAFVTCKVAADLKDHSSERTLYARSLRDHASINLSPHLPYLHLQLHAAVQFHLSIARNSRGAAWKRCAKPSGAVASSCEAVDVLQPAVRTSLRNSLTSPSLHRDASSLSYA